MSLSSALSSALSGLTASTRLADIAASNVANALTEGYGRREVHLSSRLIGNTGIGVAISGVERKEQPYILGELRVASASQTHADTRLAFLSNLEKLIGASEDAGALSSLASAFEARLIEAAAQPDSQARLSSVLFAAQNLAGKFKSLTDTIQTARQKADHQIDQDVQTLNTSLVEIDALNGRIKSLRISGSDVSALLDKRQTLIDRVAAIVPLKEIQREHDQVTLLSTGGIVLLDTRPASFGFEPTNAISADMTVSLGSVSALALNGRPLSSTATRNLLGEGRLTALFQIRDDLAPKFQESLDGLAADLVERFSDPLVDPTISPPDPGLFTDRGGPVAPGDLAGVAGRLEINQAVSPDKGGELWRLRDGVGAVLPGSAGNSSLLADLAETAAARRLPVHGAFETADTIAGLSATILSDASTARLNEQSTQVFAAANAQAFRQELLQNGVDTDQEMQALLQIEKSYAANARVLQTIDKMLDALLGI